MGPRCCPFGPCALRGVARPGSGGRLPKGGNSHRSERRLASGARPPLAARPRGGQWVSAAHVPWARLCGRWGPAPSLWRACPAGGRASRVWRGVVTGWRPLTVVGGIWYQALSLSRPPALCAGGRSPTPLFPGRRWSKCGGPAPAPQLCALASLCCALLGRREGVPGGGASCRFEGRLGSGARPSPAARPRGRAVGVRCPRGVGADVRAWGPGAVPLACVPCGGLRAAGVAGGRPGGSDV